METLDYALAYLRGGVSVIPVARDGSKRPDPALLPRLWDPDRARFAASWNPFRKAPPAEADARDWWGRPDPPGVAAVCGVVSGGLEVLDFDRHAAELFASWAELVESECPGLVGRLCLVETPRDPPGRHAWVRCPAVTTPGNAKLAVDPDATPGERTLVETRGEGGYALLPGSPACCHASGRPYRHLAGPPLESLPPVSAAEREVLLRCARSLDRDAGRPRPDPLPAAAPGELRPGDDYDRRGPDWAEILAPHGWACTGGRGAERRWRRPGKEGPAWSATTGFCRGKDGSDLLRVFSTNAAPFEDGHAYGKFRALALLEHGGDYHAAAKALAGRGYGSAPRARVPREDVRRVVDACRDSPDLILAALLETPRGLAAFRAALVEAQTHGR